MENKETDNKSIGKKSDSNTKDYTLDNKETDNKSVGKKSDSNSTNGSPLIPPAMLQGVFSESFEIMNRESIAVKNQIESKLNPFHLFVYSFYQNHPDNLARLEYDIKKHQDLYNQQEIDSAKFLKQDMIWNPFIYPTLNTDSVKRASANTNIAQALNTQEHVDKISNNLINSGLCSNVSELERQRKDLTDLTKHQREVQLDIIKSTRS